jgi:flavodoxin
MKTLIVFYSMSGNTKNVAKEIAKISGADTLELHPIQKYPDKGMKKFLWGGKSAVMGEKPVLQPYIFNADKYDMIIFGSPVWASSFTPPLRTFIDDNREQLDNKRKAAYVCFMGSGGQKALSKLKKFLGTDSFEAELELGGKDDRETKIKNFCEKLNK